MDSDEREIFEYLKGWPKHFVSAREICVRASGKRRYREEPNWAYPVLNRLLEQDLIETDSLGHYRIKKLEQRGGKRSRWISPQIAKILRNSGKEFDGVSPTDLDAPAD
jgi:hypothetical protein